MRIAVLKETASGEARVAVVPEVVQRLTKAGHRITVQRGAGLAAGSTDADYEKAGRAGGRVARRGPDRRRALAPRPAADDGRDPGGPGGHDASSRCSGSSHPRRSSPRSPRAG